MDVTNVWNLSGFSDSEFGEKVLEWDGVGRRKPRGNILAMQEYAPGVVAVRDPDRTFTVVFDTSRWQLVPDLVGRQEVSCVPPNMMMIESTALPTRCRENFDEVFAAAQLAICPCVDGMDWHAERQAPVLSSQP